MIICKYLFDSNIYNDYLPVFNKGFNYEISDTDNGDGTITRVINSIEVPSLIRFGHLYDESYSVDTIYDDSASLLNVSYLDISNITSMHSMFAYCINLKTVNTTGWNTSNITSMHDLFLNCKSLTSVDLSSFNTSKVTIMISMFNHCSSLTSLDLSNFDTSKVTNMQQMFAYCTSLTSLDLSNWDIDLTVLTSYTNMLVGASALEIINLSFANQDAISLIYNSVPYQAITVKTTPENVAYATDTAPSNVTVIDVIAIMNINTTKQQLIYNILYDVINSKIKPKTKEELLLYSIMMKGDR